MTGLRNDYLSLTQIRHSSRFFCREEGCSFRKTTTFCSTVESDLAELMGWLQQYHEQVWDRRIEDDLEAGRLDALLAEVDKEHKAGLARPL